MLFANSISKVYKKQTKAVDNISFRFEKHKTYAIIGPSGCGKTTFLLMLAGIIQPTAGTITINNQILSRPANEMALLLQNYGLLPWKTVFDNVALGLRIKKYNNRQITSIVEPILRELNLWDFKDFFPHQLSGGMQQKAAFGRIFALDPKILLLDEPLSSLDALSREKMQDFILTSWMDKRYLMIIVTHNTEEAVFLGKRILVFSNRPAKLINTIDNDSACSVNYRNKNEFFEKCRQVRNSIGL